MEELVNSLSLEQYSKLCDIADGEVPEEIREMSVDELANELMEG